MAAASAFAAGGALLASDAWHEAWRPSLRLAFEDLAKAARVRAAAEHRMLPEDDEAQITVTGVLRSDASIGPSGVSLSMEVEWLDGWEGPEGQRAGQNVHGGVALTVVGSLAAARVDDWRAGRRIRVSALLRRPSRYLDPGVPDNERALARRGTTLVGTVKSGGLVEVLARGSWWSEAVAGVRAFSRRAIAAAVAPWSDQSAAIVSAIVIGDRAGLDDSVQRRLQEAGTYHVIAISGGNIAILAGLMLGAFRVAGCLGRTAMLASIAVLVAYAALVGGGASVDRATLMAVVYFAGRALDHRSSGVNTLFVVAALLVAAAPLSVADPAFALTFGATLAILLVSPHVITPGRNRLIQAAIALLMASAATEMALFPVSAMVFSRVTFAGLVLNFLAIPLMAITQIAGMAIVPASLVSRPLAAMCGMVAHVGAAGLVWSAELVRFAPGVTYRVAGPSWWAVGVYYGSAIVSWILWTRARCARVVAAGLVIASAFWILGEPWTWQVARGDGRLHVIFIDVGQGDSTVLRFPRGSTLLVDAGGLTFGSGFDVGDRVVAPVLRELGIRRLDRIALTHGDPDHVGGASSVLQEFRPAEVWEGIPVPRFAPLNTLRVEAHAVGARWSNVYRGDHVSIDGVEVRAESPTPADWERQKVRNDDSLVLDVRWRDVSILLTGDIGKAVERGLPSANTPSLLRVLKAPHHGSLTSSSDDFVRSFRPQVVVFSVGRSNHFGHPAPDVVQRYSGIGSAIFRTDQDGAVTLDTDGRSLDMRSFTGRRFELALTTTNHKDTKLTKP